MQQWWRKLRRSEVGGDAALWRGAHSHSCGLGSRRGAAGCVRDWNLDQLIWNWIDEMGITVSGVCSVSCGVSSLEQGRRS